MAHDVVQLDYGVVACIVRNFQSVYWFTAKWQLFS